uniref:FISNA domain-containing protein n=1 Tax=Electrophorus electricus TaxID=8005 RepID=A0A4W4ER33_ELEEL
MCFCVDSDYTLPHIMILCLSVVFRFVISVYQQKLKRKLFEKFKRINEGMSLHGSSTLLSEIYTELYITEGGSGEVNNEHEVRQIETASRRPATQETPIKCNDLFKDKPIRRVLTKGVTGIGKTVSVQKFILDWAEGRASQDVAFIFPLPLRELNLMKEKKFSLMDLLHHFFPETKQLHLIDWFSDPQKEEYFRQRISDQILANKIISHMKSSRSLYIMCHIPVFCWIAVTVLERMLGEAESGEIPKTLTQMFTHFLIFQLKHKDRKYQGKTDTDPHQTRNIVAFQSKNGHLDLFLRFLLGLSLESNQTLLQGLLTQTGSSSHSKEETVKYIKEKIRENPSPEKSINLFHCLNELNDHCLVQEVQTYLTRGDYRCLHGARLSPAQWSALVFVLLNSEEELYEFDLRKYDKSEECLLRLLPVVTASRKQIILYSPVYIIRICVTNLMLQHVCGLTVSCNGPIPSPLDHVVEPSMWFCVVIPVFDVSPCASVYTPPCFSSHQHIFKPLCLTSPLLVIALTVSVHCLCILHLAYVCILLSFCISFAPYT